MIGRRATALVLALALASCGAVVDSSLPLVPSSPALREACQRAADRGGFVIPCPRLVVLSRDGKLEACPLVDQPHAGGRDCLEDSAAGNPNAPSAYDAFTYAENNPVIDGALHMFVVGVRTQSTLMPFRAGCPDGIAESGPTVSGTAAMWITCPQGSSMNAGHVMLRWTIDNVTYAVSLHGHTDLNRRVEFAVANALDYVRPSR